MIDPRKSQAEAKARNLQKKHADRLRLHGARYIRTLEELYFEQNSMLARFARSGVPELEWRHLESCGEGVCPHHVCCGACWFGERAETNRLILQASDLLATTGKPLWFVTVIDPWYSAKIGELSTISVPAGVLSIKRRFRSAGELLSSDVAFGYAEVATMGWGKRGRRWIMHFHLILASDSPRKAIKEAFRPPRAPPAEFVRYRKKWRPVMVRPVTTLHNALAYSAKRKLEYVSSPHVKRRGKAKSSGQPKASEQCELDRWLLTKSNADRLLLRGIKRVHGELTLFGRWR